ncbi:hypothetical protein FOB31_04995 [Burkholderia multivorans]|nr:hypothetical protein FOB31_04995 [Burkholderia multivorans]QET40222.1 hypothetical protein FOB30_21380 [Burkholderia multivorans]
MSCATPIPPSGPLGHVPEMTGHVAEIAGHDPETVGHVRPKYAVAEVPPQDLPLSSPFPAKASTPADVKW